MYVDMQALAGPRDTADREPMEAGDKINFDDAGGGG
jgi:hypothetical protein